MRFNALFISNDDFNWGFGIIIFLQLPYRVSAVYRHWGIKLLNHATLESSTIEAASLLAIFAHPDDDAFRCCCARVWVLCATRGEAGVPGLLPQQAGHLCE